MPFSCHFYYFCAVTYPITVKHIPCVITSQIAPLFHINPLRGSVPTNISATMTNLTLVGSYLTVQV